MNEWLPRKIIIFSIQVDLYAKKKLRDFKIQVYHLLINTLYSCGITIMYDHSEKQNNLGSQMAQK